MIKILNITKDIKLDNSINQLTNIPRGLYEVMESTTTNSGYDFIIKNRMIRVGVYLAGSHYMDYTTYLNFPLKLWGECIFEHTPMFRSIEDMLQYVFYSRKFPLFK